MPWVNSLTDAHKRNKVRSLGIQEVILPPGSTRPSWRARASSLTRILPNGQCMSLRSILFSAKRKDKMKVVSEEVVRPLNLCQFLSVSWINVSFVSKTTASYAFVEIWFLLRLR